MLAKMCGWNEPERVNVQSVEVRVDAALIEQLRAGYAALGAREKRALPLDGTSAALGRGGRCRWLPYRSIEKGTICAINCLRGVPFGNALREE
jgi:hypothetical protein